MNVLNIATLNRPIGADLGYAPIETVIYNIDKGLHELGHHSIVACSGDSRVSGEKFQTIPKSFSEYHSSDTVAQREDMRKHLALSLKRANEKDIDVIHLHDAAMTEYIYNGRKDAKVPIVLTLHVPAEEKGSFRLWNESLTESSAVFFVPISEFQKKQNQGLVNMQNVIHHGIDVETYPFLRKTGNPDYLFSIGRITPDKGQNIAIEVARQTGSKLFIAGNVQNKRQDREYFESLRALIDLEVDAGAHPAGADYHETVIKPLLDSEKRIIYIGELDSDQKKIWYGHAKALLFPIQWGEPFGLVLIEAMACGTPVAAFARGSAPEIVVNGKTGFITHSAGEMREAVRKLDSISRDDCRRHVEENFSISVMTEKYAALYSRLATRRSHA